MDNLSIQSNSSDLTPELINKLVDEYAPIVYLHLSEKFMPMDAKEYFDKTNHVETGPKETWYLEITDEEMKKGNINNAKCYVRIGYTPDCTNLIAIQYLFFYAYHGPDQAFISIPSKDNTYDLAPFNEHDGDWQSISVLVNPLSDTLLGASYMQQGEQHFYTPNQIERIDGQIVVYSSLNGHVSYVDPAPHPSNEENFSELFTFYLKNVTDRGTPWNTKTKCEIIEDMTGLTSTEVPDWAKYKGQWGKVRELQRNEITAISEVANYSELFADVLWEILLDIANDKEHVTGPTGPLSKDNYLSSILSPVENSLNWAVNSIITDFSVTNHWSQHKYYSTIQCADIDGDGAKEVIARGPYGIVATKYTDNNWTQLANGPCWNDDGGWSNPMHYSTIQYADIDGDGEDELIARDELGIIAYKYTLQKWEKLSRGPAMPDKGNWINPQYYSTIQCADIDGDGKDELLVRNADSILAYKYMRFGWSQLINGPALSDEKGWGNPMYYSTIQYADIDGDGAAELLARDAFGIVAYKYTAEEWQELTRGPAWNDENNWNQEQYYSTIQCADIDGDGIDELLARDPEGIVAYKYTEQGWIELADGPALSDQKGWGSPQYYSTIQYADIDGDGVDELLARDPFGIVAYKYTEQGWIELGRGPGLSDQDGWDQPQYYATIQCADIDGDGTDELLAKAASGLVVYHYTGQGLIQLANGPAWSDQQGWNKPEYYSTIRCGDFDEDGTCELVARDKFGILLYKYTRQGWKQLDRGPDWSDDKGWNKPEYYSTIQCGHFEGKYDNLFARTPSGIESFKYTEQGWKKLYGGTDWSDDKGWNKHEYYSTIQCWTWGNWGDRIIGRNSEGIQIYWYTGEVIYTFPWLGPKLSDDKDWNKPEYYSTIQCADIDGDGVEEILARDRNGIVAFKYYQELEEDWVELNRGPAWSDSANWKYVKHYSTIQCADIDGDGAEELIGRSVYGLYVYKFTPEGWKRLNDALIWMDADGWGDPEYYSTIQSADIDGDGAYEILGRGPNGIEVYKYIGEDWHLFARFPIMSDKDGWNKPEYYSTIQCADIDNDGKDELFARGPSGIVIYKYNAPKIVD
ncbi:MAG: FG-GAP-like repeat-containing protein [bacterium]|nr:FG-GAP-like repeat-containing protein [bacterium]